MPSTGELVWYRAEDTIRLAVYVPHPRPRRHVRKGALVRVSNVMLPVISALPASGVVYRHPIALFATEEGWSAGPVFAILAGAGARGFIGSRANFRDLLRTARAAKRLIYVLPMGNLDSQPLWTGYVRAGHRRWIPLPCPHPQAVYNQVPTRQLERTIMMADARARLRELGIPMFNPEYFNKAVICEAIAEQGLGGYLPETEQWLTRGRLQGLLQEHGAVYLKPSGGSIGHGMIRITQQERGYVAEVLKHGRCFAYTVDSFQGAWMLVQQHRLRGAYIMQAAKPLLTWQGRPCDFRILLQKHHGEWHVVGKGVRVAGPNTITTHVPNGGSIADAQCVLRAAFHQRADEVERGLDDMAIRCADAIDHYYHGQLGEMSMDVGIDAEGQFWVFEANSKPMKFDEPDIRRKSLAGVIGHLEELSREWSRRPAADHR